VGEPLLDHPRVFAREVARALDGRPVRHPRLTGSLCSRFDRFLNQLFARERIAPREAAEALEGRPGFVWLTEDPAPEELRVPGAERVQSVVMFGMTAATAARVVAGSVTAEVLHVRTHADLDAWLAVYCEVFGADLEGARHDWHNVYGALGPAGEGSLMLLLARVDGLPAATAGMYFDEAWAGLYCFTTRERMRGRGLASALVDAAHEAARARGIERALLHATPMGRSVYAGAGYQDVRSLPLLISP
jgi:GNAT superfamily N-acetyltransferase